MSSKLTAVLKKLHGKSFNSLPFINNDNVSGVRLDSIFPPSDSDISSNREPTPDGMELKLEPDEQEVLTNGEVATTGEEINPAEHDHHSSSDVTDPPEETEKDSFVPDHSISSDKFLSSKDCLEKLECFNESATLTPTLADRETAEENVDVKNDDMKTTDELNKKSRRKQQKTHRCVALDDSLLNSPPLDRHLTNPDGSPHDDDAVRPGCPEDPAETKPEIESPFDLPEGTVFVQPESVDTSPKVVSLETSRSKKIFKGGSLETAILHCTACNKQLGIDGLMDFHRHPMLKVLVCRKCYNWYTSAEIDQDTDGTDEQCRWCRQGGDLICCDFCHNSFCKSCIRRNLGRKELNSILDADDNSKWKCYVCDPRHLLGLIEHCSGVMEALTKQEKRQQEMELKRKRNIKTSHPSQASSCSSTSTVSRPSDFSTTSVAGKSSMPTSGAQQQGHLKVTKVIEPGRRNSDGKTDPRLIQPRPASLNHSFPGVSSSSDGIASHKSGFQVKGGPPTTSAASSSVQSTSTRAGFSQDQKNLHKVEKLVTLTSNMEFTLTKLLKDTRKILNSATSSSPPSGTSASVETSDVNQQMSAICTKLLKAHNFYLDTYKNLSEIGRSRKLPVSATGLKVPVVSLLAGQKSLKGNSLTSLIKDSNGNGKILVCKVASRSKPEAVNRVGPTGNKVWLAKNVGGSLIVGNKRLMPQVVGSQAPKAAPDCGNSTRTVIKIKPTGSMAAAIASGSIPLIINDSNGQQKMVLAPIVVKPVASNQTSSPVVEKNKLVSKDNEIFVISDSEDEAEKTDTVNLPEIIIHDVVVEDGSSLPANQKQQNADSTSKSNSLVLTDKFLNRAEIDPSKKSEDDQKSSPRHKRKKENDDDFVEVQSSTKKLKEDAVVASQKKSQRDKTSLPPVSQKTNSSSQVPNIPTSQKSDSDDNKVTSSEMMPPLLASNDEKLESKSQISSSEVDQKTSEHGSSQSEVKVPKKRGRKRKAEKEAEAANAQQNELKLDESSQPSLRRSARRASIPISEVNDVEPTRGIKRPSSDVQGDKAANINKESDKNSGSSNQAGAKKKKVVSSSKPTPSIVRTRRSLASIPDNVTAMDKGKATLRITRAANRKSSGC